MQLLFVSHRNIPEITALEVKKLKELKLNEKQQQSLFFNSGVACANVPTIFHFFTILIKCH